MSEYIAPMQFIDLAAQQNLIRSNIEAAIIKVLDHGQYIMGPEVKELELALQGFTGAKHALTCANGTDALTLVLMAWDIGPGDAVFVPSFTYVATAEAPALLGATPFFVDVHEDTFNMNANSFRAAVGEAVEQGLNPAVVIPVDLFGQPSEVDLIGEIASINNIKVLIDAAQSFGASFKGSSVGTLGDATTTSFFPAKPLGCYGDGGAVFTNNTDLAEKIDSVRLHGRGSEKYEHVRLGMNSRLDTLQAAILIEKLKIFPDELIRRNEIACKYNELISSHFSLPIIDNTHSSAWAQYTLITNRRDIVQNLLKKEGIPSAIYYPKSLSEQPGYEHFPKVKSDTPISNSLTKSVLSLPMHPYLNTESILKTCDVLNRS
jgi:dTDP-4-amino-4,6-dideoxygalactose transaminase